MLSLYPGALGLDLWGTPVPVDAPVPVDIIQFCLLTATILKIDGTPAGYATRDLVPSGDGTVTLVDGWKGVQVRASRTPADAVGGKIVGTEAVMTTTDANGYAQLSVVKGQTVTVTCPSFGKSVTVDTTGLDTIDLSSYF